MTDIRTLVPLNQEAAALAAAIVRRKVPENVLIGVYGVETSFGTNISTSSAGAEGAFQFIASTAPQWNYPYTNSPGPVEFAKQADAAARLIYSASQGGKNWDAGITNGMRGGYGLAQVNAQFAQFPKARPDLANALKTALHDQGILNSPGGLTSLPGDVAGAVSGVANGIAGGIEDIANAIQFIFSFQFLYIIFGSVIVVVALVMLMEQSKHIQRAAREAAKVVR